MICRLEFCRKKRRRRVGERMGMEDFIFEGPGRLLSGVNVTVVKWRMFGRVKS
jgi:hypothetical protein